MKERNHFSDEVLLLTAQLDAIRQELTGLEMKLNEEQGKNHHLTPPNRIKLYDG